MSRFKKLSHSVYECKYHLIFCPKYRFRIFKDGIAEYTIQQVYYLCSQKEDLSVLELNVQEEHVHLVLSIAPKYSVSSIMGFLKGKLSQKLFRQYDSFGRQYWGRHLRARGYCVSTIGLDEAMIRKYVKWQEKREREIENQQKNK